MIYVNPSIYTYMTFIIIYFSFQEKLFSRVSLLARAHLRNRPNIDFFSAASPSFLAVSGAIVVET